MKICWDNLENFWLTKNGVLRKGTHSYIECESCKTCGESYLTVKNHPGGFCDNLCVNKGKNNPMFGKKRPEHSERMKGEKNPNWKGGITELNIPFYDTFVHQISYAEEVRRNPKNINLLQIKCAYCGGWFTPKNRSVRDRVEALEGKNIGEYRLYCSENCKQACPIYRQVKYPKGFKHATSREVDPQLRQMVFKRDNWTCQICGKPVEEAQLHCHHMDPVAQNQMFQNDMDSCITLCKDCHGWVHTQYGCRYIDLRCKGGKIYE